MFNLSDAKEESTLNEKKYQEVGVHDNIKISTVTTGESFTKKTPFISIVTEGPNGETCESGQMYLNTEVKEGSTTSAWAITARRLVNLIMSITGKTEEEAKKSINASDPDDLAKKLSTLLVGKTFRGLFYGKEIQGKEGKNNWIKAYFAVSESNYAAETMKTNPSKLRFDANNPKHIKKLPIADPSAVVSTDSPW